MSKMFEQAVVDAEKLRDSATKLAEQKIVEKYSKEFKNTLEMILEQPEPGLPPSPDMPPPGPEGAAPAMPPPGPEGAAPDALDMPPVGLDDTTMGEISAQVAAQIPMAGVEPINNIALEEEIEIDFAELVKQLQNPGEKSEPASDMGGLPELPAAPLEEELDLADLFESLEDEDEDSDSRYGAWGEGISIDEDDVEVQEEELSFDFENVPTGHAGAPTEKEYSEADDVVAVKQVQNLQEKLKKANVKNKHILKQKREMEDVVERLKEHLSKVNLSNARLLYTNRVLGSVSLNEKQKKVFVKELSNAKTVEEAKVIYEALKRSMGQLSSKTRRTEPQSLSEAIDGKKTLLISSQENEEPIDANQEALKSHWQRLAGIK